MKRFVWIIGVLPLPVAPCTYAQNTTQTVAIGMDVGQSDNVTSTLVGPGVNVVAGGYSGSYGSDIQCSWCDADAVELPGTSLNPSMQLVFLSVYGRLTYDGHTYCQLPNGCPVADPGQSLTTSQSITFPTNATNGQHFTFTVPAEAGSFLVTLDNGSTDVLSPNPSNGELTLTFVAFGFPNMVKGYNFYEGTFTTAVSTPEPGPLGLMAMGLVATLGVGLKRRLSALFGAP